MFEPYIELVSFDCFTLWHKNEDLDRNVLAENSVMLN